MAGNNKNAAAVAPFTVTLRPPDPKLVPVRAVEADASKEDLFHLQTKFADIADPKATKRCLLFLPELAPADANHIHVFFSPGDPDVHALTGALRFSADAANAVLIVVPGKEPGSITLSAAEIVEIMRKAGRPGQIDSLWLSAHSRGYRGLRDTLAKDLLVQRTGKVSAPKVGLGAVTRVVNFDAYYETFSDVMKDSHIPPPKIFGYKVTLEQGIIHEDGTRSGNWWADSGQTVDLGDLLHGVRAVAYSRLIWDAIALGRKPLNPPDSLTLKDITDRLLKEPPPIPKFSSRTLPADFRAYCETHSAAIKNCLRDEKGTDVGPLLDFVNTNDLAGMGDAYDASIWAHQLFVAEFAHEVTDPADPHTEVKKRHRVR